ncbi:MAG TPA: DUF4249 domain-containing protein [Mucilaginibacter sp.]|jgi:hypothetical protein
MGCRKPYNPPAITASASYLVVEGAISSGPDITTIKLSRTVNLSGTVTANPVLQASVTIESDRNDNYPLFETGNGNYVIGALYLDNTRTYRLDVKTADGKQYLSDFEPVLSNPPIDSIGYTVKPNSVVVYVNTHDPGNIIKYYRWDYTETWQFHAKYPSEYVSDGTKIVGRTSAQDIFSCFGNDTSSTIVLGSTAKLKQAVIYQNPLAEIAATSEKIETKYSILVNQYPLTANAYNFWINLKKNTEQLGSIFDAEPSNIAGNIHCVTNPSEPVIGYISVCTVQSKRIFISNSQLPSAWLPAYPYTCELDSAFFCRPAGQGCQNDVALFLIPPGSTEIPVEAFGTGLGALGYLGTSVECADCTIRGTKTQPAFWK